jgi:glutamate/tyrosine decarboxylase-like PLP-dependent enzyme
MKTGTMLWIILLVALVFIALIFVRPSPDSFVFNKTSAERDIKYHAVKLITYGLGAPNAKSQSISQKYGFRQFHLGCVVVYDKELQAYQSTVEDYLDKRNGTGWRKRYNKELDSLQEQSGGK